MEQPKPIIVDPEVSNHKKKQQKFKKKKITVPFPISNKSKDAAKQKKKERKKKAHVPLRTIDILPFVRLEEDHIVLKEGVMDILQISSLDIDSLSEDDLSLLIYQSARFLRSYQFDFKAVSMNFPSNTKVQQEYWKKKREQTTDEQRLKFIDQKLYELKFLEEERTNREFFLFLYAEDKYKLAERKRICKNLFKNSFPLQELTPEKKKSILFILYNQNTKL
ncbi:hypothetical protein [Bacillus smithii]|uniref:hypothetical protein n=1 Tax=Bacillus smithii TaxID=1479 RepID=UPI00077B8813|nr:hypothetical protein [Bacillus smithii]